MPVSRSMGQVAGALCIALLCVGLAATVFVPADGGASRPPLILHTHGFGESRFGSLENPNNFMVNRITAQALLALWHQGYWVVSYDQRGFNANNLWGGTADSSNGQCLQDGDAEDQKSSENAGGDERSLDGHGPALRRGRGAAALVIGSVSRHGPMLRAAIQVRDTTGALLTARMVASAVGSR